MCSALRSAYAAVDSRDKESVLTVMHSDVVRPKGALSPIPSMLQCSWKDTAAALSGRYEITFTIHYISAMLLWHGNGPVFESSLSQIATGLEEGKRRMVSRAGWAGLGPGG